MPRKIVLFDWGQETVDAFKVVFSKYKNITVLQADVRKLPELMPEINAFVSPANSFGFMDGGIDAFFMEMFPGVQDKVQSKIRQIGLQTNLGRYYLPIGSVIKVKVTDTNGCNLDLFSAPTMFFPGNISNTKNVYYTMVGILRLLSRQTENYTIAVPGLGTGVGRLSSKDCAEQISLALSDTVNNQVKTTEGTIVMDNADGFVRDKMACKQDINVYANNEIP